MVSWTFFVRHFPWETPFLRQKTKGQKRDHANSSTWALQSWLNAAKQVVTESKHNRERLFQFFCTVFHLLVPVILFVGVWGFWVFSHEHKTKIHINEVVEETIVNLKGGKINECTFPVWFMLTEHNLGTEVHCFEMYCKRNYFIIEMEDSILDDKCVLLCDLLPHPFLQSLKGKKLSVEVVIIINLVPGGTLICACI